MKVDREGILWSFVLIMGWEVDNGGIRLERKADSKVLSSAHRQIVTARRHLEKVGGPASA